MTGEGGKQNLRTKFARSDSTTEVGAKCLSNRFAVRRELRKDAIFNVSMYKGAEFV